MLCEKGVKCMGKKYRPMLACADWVETFYISNDCTSAWFSPLLDKIDIYGSIIM